MITKYNNNNAYLKSIDEKLDKLKPGGGDSSVTVINNVDVKVPELPITNNVDVDVTVPELPITNNVDITVPKLPITNNVDVKVPELPVINNVNNYIYADIETLSYELYRIRLSIDNLSKHITPKEETCYCPIKDINCRYAYYDCCCDFHCRLYGCNPCHCHYCDDKDFSYYDNIYNFEEPQPLKINLITSRL